MLIINTYFIISSIILEGKYKVNFYPYSNKDY